MAPLRRPVAEITVSKSMTMREREIAEPPFLLMLCPHRCILMYKIGGVLTSQTNGLHFGRWMFCNAADTFYDSMGIKSTKTRCLEITTTN